MGELYCDICGKTPVRAQILLEGAKLLACARCMRGGKVIHFFDEGEEAPETPQFRPSTLDSGEEVVDDCGKKIKSARERAKLPLSVIAERVNEKESYLNAIENGRLKPTIEVARKLEKELGIKLIEKIEASVGVSKTSSSKSFTEPTLADMVEKKED